MDHRPAPAPRADRRGCVRARDSFGLPASSLTDVTIQSVISSPASEDTLGTYPLLSLDASLEPSGFRVCHLLTTSGESLVAREDARELRSALLLMGWGVDREPTGEERERADESRDECRAVLF